MMDLDTEQRLELNVARKSYDNVSPISLILRVLPEHQSETYQSNPDQPISSHREQASDAAVTSPREAARRLRLVPS